jgi:hypothetical protein
MKPMASYTESGVTVEVYGSAMAEVGWKSVVSAGKMRGFFAALRMTGI